MSLSTDTYENLIIQVESLVGDSLSPTELARVNANINLAARRAYRETSWWERFLVVSEPRTLARGVIDFSEDSYYVYGAGNQDVNGLYIRNGSENSVSKYTKYDTDKTTVLYNIRYDSSDWVISDNLDTVLYFITSAATTPPETGWTESATPAEAPRLQLLKEIDTCLLVTAENILENGNYNPLDFHSSARGITLSNPTVTDRIVYVTYKSVFTDIYGCGTNGTVESIPSEWFNYMALYAARQQQISQRQANSSPMAIIAAREVGEAMQDELMKIEEQNISNTIARRVQTHQTYNSQL